MEHNLSEIVRFHNVVRADLSEQAKTQADDAVASLSLENYRLYIAANTLLMAHSYLEEYLYLLWRPLSKTVMRGSRKSIDRYEPVLEHLGVDTTGTAWKFIIETVEIRNCLLHANGRVSHMSNPARLKAIVSEHLGALEVEHDRLKVNADFVSQYVGAVRAFHVRVQEARNRRAVQA
jgi:hypothetical protein